MQLSGVTFNVKIYFFSGRGMLSKLNFLLLSLLFIQTMLILIWNNNLAIRARNGFINEVWIDISTSWDGNFQLSPGLVNLDPLLKFTLLLLSLKSSGVFTQITQALLSSCWALSLLWSSWQISLLFSSAFKSSCNGHFFVWMQKILVVPHLHTVCSVCWELKCEGDRFPVLFLQLVV